MQAEYNDYMLLTRRYLKDYKKMQRDIDAWEQQKSDIKAELSDVSVAISRYGGEPGGGSGDMTVVERQAETRGKLEAKLSLIDHNIGELRRVMKTVETAVRALEPEACEIVWDHYVERVEWNVIADRLYLSSAAVRQRGHRAIRDVANTIFVNRAGTYEQVVLIA